MIGPLVLCYNNIMHAWAVGEIYVVFLTPLQNNKPPLAGLGMLCILGFTIFIALHLLYGSFHREEPLG